VSAVEHISIPARVRELVADIPDEEVWRFVAIDGSEVTFTWRELDRRSSQLAGACAERGLGVGDRLGIGLKNSPQFVLAVYAAWKLGAIPVPMRWDLPAWELDRLREAVDGKVHLGAEDVDWIDATADREVPDLPDVVAPRANGICSSGSTGLPKVIVSNRPGIYNPDLTIPIAEGWGPVPRPQVVLVPGPLYHMNGFHSCLSLWSGDHVVVMEKFDAAQIVDVIERHRVSTFNCTPTMLKRIADLPGIDDRDLSSIQWICQGAAPMPPYLVHRWADLIGPEKVIMAYGMSEGLGITAIRGDEWMGREGSVGRPARDTEMKVLDEAGDPVPPGEIGEIYLRSPTYGGSDYLGGSSQPKMTEDGFCSVGDLGYLDEEGFLYVVDRRTDLIITGGANVYPAEVEIALMEHPGVADVAVVGLKDEEWGRRVHAIIQAAAPDDPPTFDDIRAWAKDRVAAYKVPKSIEIVDEIPRSAATKVNRGKLLEERGG
jgi:bile acid-coenzyme A ligase